MVRRQFAKAVGLDMQGAVEARSQIFELQPLTETELYDLLQRALGLKVSIEDKNGRGRVIIEYSKLDDFDALMERLGG